MKYNYSREKIKWENEKILEEKLLKDNNIDQTIIKKLRDYDWIDFNKERSFRTHQNITKDVFFNLTETNDKKEINSINDLMDEIENENLYKILSKEDDVEKSSIIYEMNNINQKVLNEISTYANNRERIQNLTDEFTEIMYHDRISNNDVERIDYIFDQLVHHIGLDAPVLAACTNTIFNTINEYKEEYIQEFIRLNPQLNEEMISVELDTYKDAAYELNKIFVETVGTIKKCDIDAINEAVDLFFDQDEPTDLIQIFVANTIQILNQPDLLVDVLGLSVLINEIIINHQLDDFNPNLWKMNQHRFFSIDYKDYLDEDENQDAYN